MRNRDFTEITATLTDADIDAACDKMNELHDRISRERPFRSTPPTVGSDVPEACPACGAETSPIMDSQHAECIECDLCQRRWKWFDIVEGDGAWECVGSYI